MLVQYLLIRESFSLETFSWQIMHFFQSTLWWSSAWIYPTGSMEASSIPLKVVLYKKKTFFCLITRKLFSKFRMHGFLNKVEVKYTTNRSNLTYLDSLLFDFLQSSCSTAFTLSLNRSSYFISKTPSLWFNFFLRQNFSTQPVCAQLKTKWRFEVASFSC